MWTQRDQIQAYQFLRRRLVSALVVADANHPVSPSRRLVIGSALGVAATVLTVAGFGVAGALHPSVNSDWRSGGQVIVEKETGARFVLGKDQKLHPILNYASARLLAGGDGTKTVTVAAKTLASTPRGATLGILSAPDSLPQPAQLLTGPWTACSQQPSTSPTGAAPTSTLILGAHRAGTRLAPANGLVVRIASGARYLLNGGKRFRISDSVAAVSLGYDAASALTVSAAFLAAVPAGHDLAAITVPGAGNPGPMLSGTTPTKVGQVLSVGTVGAGTRYYLVRADGLVPITQTEASLVLGNPANALAYHSNGVAGVAKPLAVSAFAVGSAPRSATPAATGYPDPTPRPVAPPAPGGAVCAQGNGISATTLFTAMSLPLPAGTAVTVVPASAKVADQTADQVEVPPGAGALVGATQSPGAPVGTTYLITDTGRRYPVPTAAAVSSLGYTLSERVGIGATVLDLLPTGVSLDPVAAEQVVTPASAR